MKLSIIIISHNTQSLTLQAIESLVRHTKGVKYEIIVVDNASTDDSVEKLTESIKSIKLIKNKTNFGFARANNQGLEEAKGEYVLFLNSDTKFTKNILKGMIDWMDEHKDVGVVTCKLLNKNGTLQPTGGHFPSLLSVVSWMTIQDFPLVDSFIKPFHPKAGFYKKQKELDWATGAFLLSRRDLLKKVGGWDTDYFMYTEDVDLCYRIKSLGKKVMFLPKWSIVHFGKASSSSANAIAREYEGVKLFYKKHYSAWRYWVLRLFLLTGALGRIVLFGILRGRREAGVYVQALKHS